jgi:hypothetical protein
LALQVYHPYPSLNSLAMGMEGMALDGGGSGMHLEAGGPLGYPPMPHASSMHLGGGLQLAAPGAGLAHRQSMQRVQVVPGHGHSRGGEMLGRSQLVALAVCPGSSAASASPELDQLGLALQGQGQRGGQVQQQQQQQQQQHLEQAVMLTMQLSSSQMGILSNHLFTIQTMTAAQIRSAPSLPFRAVPAARLPPPAPTGARRERPCCRGARQSSAVCSESPHWCDAPTPTPIL